MYGLSLSEFFSEPEKPDEPQVVINQDDLIEMGSQGVSMKLVHNGNPNRTLAMIFETYQPGTTTGERIKHQGEEIGTVLEGEIVLTINGQDYHLVAGQSYAINTGIPHSFSNTSAGILPNYQRPYAHHVLIFLFCKPGKRNAPGNLYTKSFKLHQGGK